MACLETSAPPSTPAEPDGLGVVTWRCPRCGRIANRMRVDDDGAAVVVEHRCKCGALSHAVAGGGGGVVVVRGRMS